MFQDKVVGEHAPLKKVTQNIAGSAFGVSYSLFGSTIPAFGTSINATLAASSTPVLAFSWPSPTPAFGSVMTPKVRLKGNMFGQTC